VSDRTPLGTRWGAVARYLSSYRGSAGAMTFGIVLSLLRAVTLIPVPLLVGRAIDRAIPDRDIGELTLLGAAVVGLTLANAGISILARKATVAVTKRSIERLRGDAIDVLLGVSRSYYVSTDQAELHDRLVTETGRIDQMNGVVFGELLPGSVLIVGITVILFRMDPVLTGVTLAFVPLMLLAGRLVGHRLRSAVRAFHKTFERFSEGSLRLIRAMDLIRMQASEDTEREFHRARIAALRESSTDRAISATVYGVTQQSIIAIAGAAVLVAGGAAVIRGRMTLGDLLSFYAGFAIMRSPLGSLAGQGPTLIEGVQALDHLQELLDEEDREPYAGTRVVEPDGGLHVDRVTFGYGAKPVLREVSLEVRPGEVLALVGPNGSGKSTIVNLILGFYRPASGRLSVSGVPYDDADIRTLRRAIGVVPQHPILLPMSVRENVTFGRTGLSEAEVERAIRAAHADAFVAGLAEGLDTQVGEGGVFLSGGQRQRLALARALVHRPRLLILDEPTNHLDQEAVAVLLESVRTFDPDVAILVISHRKELLDSADRALGLVDGKVVAEWVAPRHRRPGRMPSAG
jgi:ABC-type multidrug transport system fused ATPase/permease subunit